MHEYSIVMALIEQCEALAKQHQAIAVERVDIKVGILSGVEPSLLAQAFNTFKLDGICAKASLDMHIQPLVLQCNHCNTRSEQMHRVVLCPDCNSADTRVVDGEDMMLMQLEMDT
ncbi:MULTISPECIES: hydrogenase maturation nickel metallochaperone HypA [Pseudomonadati]|uniref:Hydrogenase maturation factor HypA n=1 Tax=Shewanella aestuarii TaxID=1028752 RepID=A0ABT0KX84_9GAMM|nr:hydrogenase maturation nickel metallochaperone HypA [Shewanella aestuarii]MCL1116079.1 hydrogenase maturation nickel metallochaperone HypA [Shewanella aestuarii]GGN70335.1 putative hydrogenase nickel incorporation protein HypA [Shewanella aestuarii]